MSCIDRTSNSSLEKTSLLKLHVRQKTIEKIKHSIPIATLYMV